MDEIHEIERTLRCIDQRTTELADHVTRVPVATYLDADRFAAELALLRRAPIVVGHASQLRAPGSFFTAELAGRPLLLTRPADGPPRAFLNVCRHRGTRLVAEAEGAGRHIFACPYHAWTYRDDGRLLGISHERSFGAVDRDQFGLVPLALVERAGLLWVALAGDADPGLPPALADELAWLGLGTHVRWRPTVRRWHFNWKLGVDGGLEAYHFRHAHAKTIAPLFFDNLLIAADHAPHARMTLAKRSIEALPAAPRSTWRLRDHANLLYFLFPNTFLLAQPDHVALIRMLPVDPGATDIEISMLIPGAPRDESTARHWDRNHALTMTTLDEDFVLGERIQSTLASGANTHLTFGRNEPLLARFHRALGDRLTQT